MTIKARFFVWLLLLLFSCCKEPNYATNPDLKPFFDVKGYFDGEVLRLHSKSKALKLVIADGHREEKLVDSIDFKRELDVFVGSDINRPAWSDKYVVDSTFNVQNELARLDIKSIDDKLKTRRIVVEFKDAFLDKILIENTTNSSIASSNQVLTYQPLIGFAIESFQKGAMSDEQFFKIEVRFLK